MLGCEVKSSLILTSLMLWWATVRSALREGRFAVALRIASLSGAFCSCFLWRTGNTIRFHNPQNREHSTAESGFLLFTKASSSALQIAAKRNSSLATRWVNSTAITRQLPGKMGPVGLLHFQSLHLFLLPQHAGKFQHKGGMWCTNRENPEASVPRTVLLLARSLQTHGLLREVPTLCTDQHPTVHTKCLAACKSHAEIHGALAFQYMLIDQGKTWQGTN